MSAINTSKVNCDGFTHNSPYVQRGQGTPAPGYIQPAGSVSRSQGAIPRQHPRRTPRAVGPGISRFSQEQVCDTMSAIRRPTREQRTKGVNSYLKVPPYDPTYGEGYTPKLGDNDLSPILKHSISGDELYSHVY